MKDSKGPTTQATMFLKANKVAFTDHLYAFEEHGGAGVSARELGVDEYAVIKTLVMEKELKKPLIVLMKNLCCYFVASCRIRAIGQQETLRAAPESGHSCSPE